MEKKLILKKQNGNIIAEIFSFTYNAKRMGGAPTISATLHPFNELALTTDDYVEFNGERYYIKHTPTSSKSNTDARYKYDLEFVSERVMLDDIYFHDASWSGNESNKAISKGSNFHFVGSIRTLADKINASLAFSKVEGYRVVVSDEFDELEEKYIQFSDVFLSNAIQEFYNTYKIPYYYEWNENDKITYIHVTNGSASTPDEVFEYGKDNALLSITKSNANYKIINKCTGVGSSENIPYYYPNLSSTGEHTFEADKDFGDVSINYDILDKHTNLRDGATLTYHKKPSEVLYKYLVVYSKWERKAANATSEDLIKIDGATSLKDTSSAKLQTDGNFKAERVSIEFTAQANDEVSFAFQQGVQTIDGTDGVVDEESVKLLYEIKEGDALAYVGKTIVASTALNDGVFSFTAAKNGTYSASVYILFKVKGGSQKKEIPINLSATFTPYRKVYKEDYFTFDDSGKEIGVSLSGVRAANPKDGGKIVVSDTLNWLEPQGTLMPTIYRETNGLERYYIASNEDVVVDEYQYGFDGHEFANPFVEGRPKEHIITVDDLKPTIKGMSVNGERIDMFSAFAYDVDDNDEIDENNHYKHPYFYAKLRKIGFNLFEHASEKGGMIISFTSGQCAACSFTVMVDEKTGKNLVQVDGDKVFIGSSSVDKQQDTINNEVWIALKKDESTMGVIMPNVTANKKPSVDDTFVITNINLPTSYITHAEKVLEDKIKEYLISNNDDKFNFSIKFSRIYLAEHDDVKNSISENSSLWVKYQNSEVLLYVSSYTYKMSAGDALPEITVELTDTLASNKGIMKNVISQVKMEVMSSISNVDIVAQGARAFIRKDQNDQTVHRLSVNELDVTTNSNIGENLDVENNVSVGGELTVDRKTTIMESLNVGADITVGDYKEILGEVDGAKIAQDGSAFFKSVRANYLEIFTLIYNQIQATSAYTAFDDTATITNVQSNSDGTYTLTFEGNEDYIQPFVKYDIVYGIVNSLNNYGYSINGECWMNVVETHIDEESELNSGQVRVALFSNDDVPNGTNIHPTTNMVVAHRGNNGAGDFERKDRQHTFYISSRDGSIVQLMDVTSPKLIKVEDGYSNYGVVLGKLPEDLFIYIKDNFAGLKKEDPVLYAKYLIAQNFIQVDYLGRPIKTERYRGEWSQSIAEGEDPYRSLGATDVTYYDTVTHKGTKWQCSSDKTDKEPSTSTAGWVVVVSAPPQYELKPSVNVIYYRTATGQLSVNKITVTVGETSAKGYTELVNQGMLDERGLTVYYTITDESGESGRTKLSIAQADALGTEDGGVFITEDGAILMLEGEGVSVLDTYERITFYLYDKDGKERASYIVPIMKDGKGVTVDEENTKTRYTKSANGTSHPSISENIWSDDVPAVEQGMFLWTWTHVVYSDGTSTDMFSVSYQGVNGGGVIDADVDYYASEKPLTEEQLENAEFSENYPSDTPDGWWIYVRTTTYYDNNGTEFSTVSYSGNQVGVGSYYSGLQEYYATGENNITPPSGYPREGVDGAYSDGKAEYFPKNTPLQITGSWSKTRQTMTGGKNSKYLWNFSVSYDSQGNAYVTAPIIIANFSKGIFTIQELYAISKYSQPDSGGKHPSDIKSWVDEQQDAAPTTDKPYQWNMTVTKYNDGTTEEFYHVSAVKGNKGEQGEKGDDGINYMVEVNPLTVQIPVDPDTGNTINSSTAIISFRLLVNGKPLEDISGYTLSVLRDTNGTAVAIKRYSKSDGVIELTLNKNQGVEQRVNQLKIQLLKDGVLVTGTVSFNYIQRGMVGRTGDAGPMPVMSGWYDKTLPYKLFYNSDGRCTGTPIVQNKADDRLYMLVKDIPTDGSGNVRIDDDGNPVDENGRRVDLTNSKYWDMAQYNAFLQAAILFANFASFGGKNGGVFYDRYLFSQNGVDSQGEPSGWSDHADEMFDKNGDFTNVFTPNLRLNFLTGELYGKNAYIEGVVNARGGVFKNISTPNNKFVINEDGTIVAEGGQFKNGNIVLGAGNILMRADGSGYLSKGTISFENDGSGSIGNGMFLWDKDGNLCQKRHVEELYVNVSEMGSKGKYAKLQHSTFTKGGYRLNLNDGDHFDLYRSIDDPDFVVLPSSVSIATAPEGFVTHGRIKITVYIPFTTRASSYFEVLSWNDSKIYIKERDGRTYKYTEIGAGETAAIPYNTPCTFVYSTIVKDDVYVTAWVADF